MSLRGFMKEAEVNLGLKEQNMEKLICRLYTLPFTALRIVPASTRSVQKESGHVLWKIETFPKEDIRYKKHCTQDNDASVPFKVGTLGPHTVLPITISCPILFFWTSSIAWNPFHFKSDFSFGKARSPGYQVWAIGRLSHLDNFMFCQKTLHKTWCMNGHIVVMNLPITSCP